MDSNIISRCKPLLGTFVEIEVPTSNAADAAIQDAFQEIERIHNLMSFFDKNSQVSLLNKTAKDKPVKVDKDLFDLLSTAQNLSKLSNGIFDITRHHSPKKYRSSFQDIELSEDHHVYFKKPVIIDLAGIAKGHAVDKAAEMLHMQGIQHYVINAGGDLRVGNQYHHINIRNPKKPEKTIHNVTIKNSALATSSGCFSYTRKFGRKTYPLFNKDHKPLTYKNESTTVLANQCVYADALTKITAILQEDAQAILSALNASALFITQSGKCNHIN